MLKIFDVGSFVILSLLIVGGLMVLLFMFGVFVGYVFVCFSYFVVMGVVYFFMMICMVLVVVVFIFFYLLMCDIGLIGSWMSVVLINCVLNIVFVSWMMFFYFCGLLKELEEVVFMDGCW